jgi:hypothetical protein
MRAALILVGLGALAVMEIQSPPRTTKPVDARFVQTTLAFAASGDTLTAADRLELPHTQQKASAQQIFSPEPIVPPVQPTVAVAQEPQTVVEQPARAVPAEKPAVVLPKPRPKDFAKNLAKNLAKDLAKDLAKNQAKDPPKDLTKHLPKDLPKHRIAREAAKTTRSKPTVEAKSCQPGAFDGLFKALSLPLGCQT